MLEISWRPLCSNTILFEILLTKECGMLRIFLKHFAWKALSRLSSALLSHACVQTIQQFRKYASFKNSDLLCLRENSVVPDTAQCLKFPPWTLPWHEILHHWNERVKFFTSRHGLKSWSAVCLGQYWKFAHYVSNLPRERWVVRAMNWFPENARRVGRPAYTWDSMIQHFCRHKQIGNWRERARNISFWMSQFDDFLSFTDTWWTWNVNSICCAYLRPERAACFGMQVSLTHSLTQDPSVCMKCPWSCLEMEINICMMIHSRMEQAPEPFVWRSTV